MKRKILRQAIIVSPNELKKIADELDKEIKDLNRKYGSNKDGNKTFLIPIINKIPECSDTWQFEK